MIEIRRAWELDVLPNRTGALTTLLEIESKHLRTVKAFREAAAAAFPIAHVHAIEQLLASAKLDLVAGSELACAGYIKQALSLWRSWYEQTLFAVYFIEAPLHRSAWRWTDKIEFGKEPRHKLMLHQLLVDKGEKSHPFGIVFSERARQTAERLKLPFSQIKTEHRPIEAATARLSDLSQGVHGTFQPTRMLPETLEAGVRSHAVPLLRLTAELVGFFFFLSIAPQIDVTDDSLLKISRGDAVDPGDADVQMVALLGDALRDWLLTVRK